MESDLKLYKWAKNIVNSLRSAEAQHTSLGYSQYDAAQQGA